MTDIYAPERRLKAALQEAWEGDYITIVCQYLRETLQEYGDRGKVATKLVDIIEGEVS